MADERSSELENAVQRELDTGEFPWVDFDRVWRLVSELLEDQTVELFHTGPLKAGGYTGFPGPALQVVVCTPAVFYDCAFSASATRYDVSYVADIYRLAETWDEEQSVDGPPRKKLTVKIDFKNYQLGLVLELTAYGDKADELHAFARAVYRLTMARSK
jgi:hypothetical protein